MFRTFLMTIPVVLTLAACGTSNYSSDASRSYAHSGKGKPLGNSSTNILKDDSGDVIYVSDRVFFALNSHLLTDEGKEVLKRQSEWLKQNPNITVTIEGHCDERGTREYNIALGEHRANSVKKHLNSLGVPSSRISTISYGKERPDALGSNQTAWAENRRSVTVVNQ